MNKSPGMRSHQLQFTGKGFEYFKIWIVNIVLSIVTLGIYSAWAKVRNKRYFYSNTILDGTSFEYLASPITILRGRILAFAVLIVFSITSEFLPILGIVFALILLALLPWLIISSLRFNARNSAYRNVSFDFDASVWEAVVNFILLPLLVMITFGLAIPFVSQRVNRFIVSNSSFGTSPFRMHATIGKFYGIYLEALILILLYLVGVFVFVLLVPDAFKTDGSTPGPNPIMFLFSMVTMVFYVFLGVYVQTAIFNLVFGTTTLSENAVTSNLKASTMLFIQATNLLMVIFSIGLLIPFAKIRLAKYKIGQLGLRSPGGLDDFVARESKEVKAFGEELAEALDIDLGL